MKTIITTALFSILFLFSVNETHAAGSSCQIIYGGGEVCPPQVTFTLKKQVQRPGKGGDFVDNLTINDPKFSLNDIINFQLTVQNTGGSALSSIKITDTLPTGISFVSAEGCSNKDSIVTCTIESLDAGKSKSFFISTKPNEKALPAGQGVTCVINSARAVDKNGVNSEDSSQICIEKAVLPLKPTPQVFQAPPVKEMPPTGPEMIVLPLLGGTGALGWILRRKTSQ